MDELHICCYEGSIVKIKDILNSGNDVNQYNEEGFTALHIAVQRPDASASDVVKCLLERQANPNAITLRDGDTALHLLAKHVEARQAADVALTLLMGRADATLRNRTLRTPYDYAVVNDKMVLADVLTSNIADSQENDGDQSLKDAKLEGMQKKAKEANLGTKLIRAVIEGRREDVKLEIKNGANVNFINEHGAGALHYAISHCSTHRMKIITVLIASHADVNLQDHEGDTALNLAIKMDNLRTNDEMKTIVKLLLGQGADKNIKDIDGRDALKVAEKRGYRDIVHILRGEKSKARAPKERPKSSKPVSVTKKADPKPPKQEDPSPVQIEEPVAEQDDDDDDGIPDPTKMNENGLFPLHETIQEWDDLEEILQGVTVLVEMGADVNAKTSDAQGSNTAVHLAIKKNLVGVVRKLFDVGAHEDIKNKAGKSPLDVAQELGHTEIEEMIKSRMAARNNWQKGAQKAKNCIIL